MKTLLKTLGYFSVCSGFLLGSLAAVLEIEQVAWSAYGPALALGIVGVVTIRAADQRHKRSAHTLSGNIDNASTSLAQIVERIRDLNARKRDIDTYAVRFHIDEDFHSPISSFVDARESIAHQYGLQAYADIMSSFAAAERYLNRVWSASADGYIDEVHEYLSRAQSQFEDSHQRLQQLTA